MARGTSSGQTVTVEVYGDEIVARELEATAMRALSMEPLWTAIGRRMEEAVAAHFASEGSRSGEPWEPLSNEYMWRKWQQGESLDIMRASEALYNSLTGPGGHSVRAGSADTFVFGSTLPQFAFHQDRPADAPYPERLPVDFTNADELELADMMLSYIVGSLDRFGRQLPRRYPAGAVVGGTKVGGRFFSGGLG